MDKELFDEINYEIQLLIKIGFYSDDEILEIIADEFIEEDISVYALSGFIAYLFQLPEHKQWRIL